MADVVMPSMAYGHRVVYVMLLGWVSRRCKERHYCTMMLHVGAVHVSVPKAHHQADQLITHHVARVLLVLLLAMCHELGGC